jgi:hypothetical protein
VVRYRLVIVRGLASVAMAMLGVSCASAPSSGPFHRVADAAAPGFWRAHGEDRFEVWICHVPADTTATIYGGLPLRRALTPAGVASLVGATVTPYFDAISHGQYHPVFVPGGEVTMVAGDEPRTCVDRAIAGAGADTHAVLAVADAEHAPGQQGGFGDAGVVGAVEGPVRVTHRAAYIGAADFNPSWGQHPPMDLVEHEVGHTLGWVHSGTAPGTPEQYLSALDVMSNSAAPRATDPTNRDAPDTLALDRVISGWLSFSDITVATVGARSTVRLAPSTGPKGKRLVVLPVNGSSFLTVERLVPTGHDAHLPHEGIAVHRVTVTGTAVASVTPLVGGAPFIDLLQEGGRLTTDGWTIEVGAGGAVVVQPA